MSYMARQKFPRHMRLFELMRQKERAEETVARVDRLSIQISRAEAEKIKAMAQQSLMRRL